MRNIIFGGYLPPPSLSIKVIVPMFIVHLSFKGELQLFLEDCKHIRGIIPFGYHTEGATCKMLMLLLKSQVESAFKKLDISYIRYNLQCVIILMCIQSCVVLHVAYLRFFFLWRFLSFEMAPEQNVFKVSFKFFFFLINIRIKELYGTCSHSGMNVCNLDVGS